VSGLANAGGVAEDPVNLHIPLVNDPRVKADLHGMWLSPLGNSCEHNNESLRSNVRAELNGLQLLKKSG
jgi:hypothetical protein